MSEPILLTCIKCVDNGDFIMWYNPGSDTIAAQCQECGAVQVWRNV